VSIVLTAWLYQSRKNLNANVANERIFLSFIRVIVSSQYFGEIVVEGGFDTAAG
jgi:hypothetical protein